MDFSAFHISAAGMATEKLRLDVTAANLANMHTSAAPGSAGYRPLRLVQQAAMTPFSAQFLSHYSALQGGQARATVQALDVAPRTQHEPGHPHADAQGMVSYPGVNHAAEMVEMSRALRAYEANVTAMNAAKTMAARTLEIGGQ